MTPTHFATGSAVRLTAPVRELQPQIGDAIGRVLEGFDGAVRVQWPDDRIAWHRAGDLERVA